jgi:signal transduction histidine kinase
VSETSTKIAVVLVLTLAALAVPCGAWWVVGSRNANQEAQRLAEAPLQEAQATADDLARRLTARLEGLREAESTRPYQHYMHQYHGTDDDCACPVPVTSPLAAGQSHPLIAAHFQIDDLGHITLPTLGGTAGQEPHPGWLEEQHTLLELLASAGPLATDADGNPIEVTPVIHTDDEYRDEYYDQGVETLETLGPFRWRTIPLGGEPRLAALREVTTDHRLLTQGFIVSTDALEDLVGAASFPVRVRTGDPAGPGEAALALGTIEWRVSVDPTEAAAAAERQAASVKARFVQVFLLGSGAALIAGLAIVGVVWQTERLSSARARFAAAAAHELRSPLAGIRLYGEMLADDLGKPEKTREYARKVSHEAEQLGRVVGNVLGYSRLERGHLPIHPQRGDLGHSVRDSVERLRPSIEAAGARLDLSTSGDPPEVAFDADAVHHIVQNLVDNAAKFSREAKDRTVHVRVSPDDGGVTLEVADHGPGIPGLARRRLFRPFTRGVDDDHNTGLGLGLVLVRALVDAHGGSVEQTETPGGGATFIVRFPA